MTMCLIEGCAKRVVARGWCTMHYQRWRKYGNPQIVTSPTITPPPKRFWSKVLKTESCWLWQGAKNSDGYGSFALTKGKTVSAHRAAYGFLVGVIPIGLELDHLCRVRHCVRPAHLELVGHIENVRRGLAGAHQGCRTHCPQGHAYDQYNTYHQGGRRHCRTCRAARARARRVATA